MTFRQINMYAWVAIMWGASFAFLVPVVNSLNWAATVTFRAFLASAIVYLIAKATKRNLDFGKNWTNLAVLGLTSVAMNLSGLNFALDRIGTQLAAILVTTIPLFGVLFESIWLRALPTKTKLFGLIIGFAGVVILIGLSPQAMNKEFLLGFTGSIIGATGFAIGGVYSKARASHLGSWEQTIGTFLFGGLWTLPLIFFVPIFKTPTFGDILCLIAVAATGSALAYILYFKLVAEVGASTALSTEFLVPVVAVILGYFLFSEKLTVNQILGSIVIMIGCALVMELNPFSKTRSISR